MEIQDFLNLIKNKKQTIAIVTMLFVLTAVAFTFIQPLRYSSVSKVLVIQALPEGVDPYQVSKSNEYVASLLTQIIATNSFFKEVIDAGFNIEKTYFPETGDKQMKLWRKTVKASSNASGIITIKAYHNNRVQVGQLSQAINFILESKHKLYHGFGDLVNIKIIEQPVTSDRPIKPNVFINISVALAFGLLVSFTYIYLFPNNRYSLHLSSRKNNILASDNIESDQDEFEIKNNDVAINDDVRQAVNVDKEIDEKIENNEDLNIYNELRAAMEPPVNLPTIDVNDKAEIKDKNSLGEHQPRDVKKQGSMGNIINQTNQRG